MNQKSKKGGFISMLLGTLDAGVLRKFQQENLNYLGKE